MARRKCTVCGSKRWHKEPASGLVACSEGHVLQNYRNETIERDELGPHAARKRTLRAERRAREEQAGHDPNVYRGARGRALYFACLQLLVRAQAAALAARWALPPAFEAACRDVWALHLRLLDGAAPPLPDADLDGDGDARAGPAVKEEEGKGKEAAGGDGSDDGESNSGSDDGGSHASDPDMHSLMDELEASASSSDDENADRRAVRANTRPATRGRRRRHSAAETPAAGLAVVVLACWTLRVPVTYPDFIRLIESYELPYLEPVRRGPLPASMVTHLTKYAVQALSPPFAPTASALHALTARLARRLHARFGVLTPPANAAPLMWRTVRALGGTAPLYALTKRLARALALPLVLHPALAGAPAARDARGRWGARTRFSCDGAPPELALAATALVVLKLVYGLDGRPRMHPSGGMPAAMPDVKRFMTMLLAAEEDAKGVEFDVHHTIALETRDDAELDALLDLSERALLGDASAPESARREPGARVLEDHFPRAPRASTARAEDGPRRAPAKAAPTRAAGTGVAIQAWATRADEKRLRPGEEYALYHARDVRGAQPGAFGVALARAAEWAGVGVDTVGTLVEVYERRLLGADERARRRSKSAATDRVAGSGDGDGR